MMLCSNFCSENKVYYVFDANEALFYNQHIWFLRIQGLMLYYVLQNEDLLMVICREGWIVVIMRRF